jgi:ABC-2 type transport system permease protein
MITKTLSSAKYALLSFRRNPAATFFTIIFPVLFLVIFGLVFGSEETGPADQLVKVSTFIVPGILALSIVSATFVNLAMNQVIRREAGQLKRLRGTPLSPLGHIIGQILASLVIVVFMTVLVTVIGRLFFGVEFNLSSIGVFALSIGLGSVTFSALGLAITAIIPNDDAAPAVTNATVFPLYFISDVFFFSDDDSSGFIDTLGDIFPVKPLTESLQDSYNPFIESVSLPWGKWAVIAAWGVFGIVAAAKFFKWTPQTERR